MEDYKEEMENWKEVESWNEGENWNISDANVFGGTSFPYRPPSTYNFLQFILIYDEHNALVGATNMNDVIWNGIICHYNDISYFDDINDETKSNYATMKTMEYGVCDAVYLTHNKFVVVGDAGDVEILRLTQNEQNLQTYESLCSARQHDSSVLTVSMFSNKRSIITGAMDGCINIWDIEDLIATYSFDVAHVEAVTGIDVKPMCNSTFVSTGHNEALLWDVRRSRPAHCLFETDCHLSTVSWKTASDHIVAIGGDNGIVLIDIRQSSNSLYDRSMTFTHDRSVHKLLFNPDPERKEQLACCFDGTPVKVFDASKELCPIFEVDTHSDFVRDLAWYKNNLFSCSWDGSVIKHTISFSDNQ